MKLLETHDPNGLKVYNKFASPQDFAFWLTCDDPTFNLPSAVHESTHQINNNISTRKRYQFYLPGGDVIGVAQKALFPRSEAGLLLEASEKNTYYQTYLIGASGRQDLLVLLDEVNAYTHGLISSTSLVSLIPANLSVSARDGIANMLYFTELYVRQARLAHPGVWHVMAADSEYRTLLQTLWTNAEDALNKACAFDSLGLNDGPILKKVFSESLLNEMSALFKESGDTFKANPKSFASCGATRSAEEGAPATKVIIQTIKTVRVEQD